MTEFTDFIEEKGRELYRPMPWREDTRPYFVLVSELMLQQTQVERVVPKFEAFIKQFPNEKALAAASLAEVLHLWSGLGYNRRAKFLHEAAKMIVNDMNNLFPSTKETLLKLPGVGANTAGAILAYAFNKPAIFIETNVRTVYFYHFFPGGDKVDDNEIMCLLEQTLQESPRDFYYALMDYSTWLKRQKLGNVAQSRHYKKQSVLKGSLREMRGRIIRELVHGEMTAAQLQQQLISDERFESALTGLLRDGLLQQKGENFYLTK